MKKHLVLLTGIYYPDPSPTGLCSHRYMQLLQDRYDIDVIFSQSGLKTFDCDEYEGFKLHSITSWRFIKERSVHGAIRIFFHFLGQVQIMLYPSGNMKWYRKKALRKLEYINRKNPIDIIFTTCSPFEAHLAGIDYKKKHPEVKHIAYSVDLYSTHERVRPFYLPYKCIQYMEKRVFESVDTLLISDEIYDSQHSMYSKVNQVQALPYQLPTFPDDMKKRYFDNSAINCVYAGRFYEDIRNPEFLLEIFSSLNRRNVILHLFFVGCEKIVSKYSESSSSIVIHKQLPQKQLTEVLISSDCLINLGNSTPSFKPSKTFEYIVTGKPIVNIHYPGLNDEDLSKYPVCLQMPNNGDINNAKERIMSFLETSKDKTVSKDTIESIYYRHSANAIKEILINAIEK